MIVCGAGAVLSNGLAWLTDLGPWGDGFGAVHDPARL